MKLHWAAIVGATVCVASTTGSASAADPNPKNTTISISTAEPTSATQQEATLSGICGGKPVSVRTMYLKSGPRVFVTVRDKTSSYGTETAFVRDLFAGKGTYQLFLSCGQGLSVWAWGESFTDQAKPRFVKAEVDFTANGDVAAYSQLLDEQYAVVRGYLR